MRRRIKRWFRRFKVWLYFRGLAVSDPELYAEIVGRPELGIRDAHEVIRNRNRRPYL